MADGVAELRPVERVEMELPHAPGIELRAKLGGDGGGDELARRGQIVEPLEQPVEPGRDGGAAQSRELAGLGDVGDGQMPGAISAPIPAAATSSRKRRKQEGEKKNWLIARSAPASILRLRLSRSATAVGESGWHSG